MTLNQAKSRNRKIRRAKKNKVIPFKASEHKKYLISLVTFGWKSVFDTKLLKEILETAMAIGNFATAAQIRKRLA